MLYLLSSVIFFLEGGGGGGKIYNEHGEMAILLLCSTLRIIDRFLCVCVCWGGGGEGLRKLPPPPSPTPSVSNMVLGECPFIWNVRSLTSPAWILYYA